MPDRIERNARLLCEAWFRWMHPKASPESLAKYVEANWEDSRFKDRSTALHVAGLTLARIEPDEATVERVATAAMEAFRRYQVEGTSESEDGYGPPYRAPWFLIDTSTAEPEVNWPGQMVAEFQDGSDAYKEWWRLVARAALRAAGEG
jgi:hypothetical protein